MSSNVFYKISKSIAYLSLGSMVLLPALVQAEAKKPEASDNTDVFASVLDSRVSRYKKSLAQLAEDPVIIAAVRESNKKGNAGNMSNSEWMALAEDDPKVLRLNKNETGELLGKFEKSRAFEKLNVRDAKGNLVVFSSNSMKPLVYNAADRPGYMNGLKGVWSDSAIKPDPTTLKMAVQIAAPIKDEGKVIGVIHSSVTAE